MGCILCRFLEAIGPSVGVIYAFGQMDHSSESTESVTALDENLVIADSPDLARLSSLLRSGRFTDVPYAAKNVLSTLSRSRLEGFRHVYQIPKSVTLRVLDFNEWACSCLPGEVSIFEQALEASLRFPIPLFVRHLLTHLRLALGQVMPNSWRILISCMVLWPACNGGQDHITVPEFLYCYKVVEMHLGWWYFTARVLDRVLIMGLPMSNRG